MARRGPRRWRLRLLGRTVRARRRRLAFLGVLAALLVAGLTAAAAIGPGVLRAAGASAEQAHAPAPSGAAGARPSDSAPPVLAAAPAAVPAPSPAPAAASAPASSGAQPAWQDLPASLAGTVAQFVSSQGAAGAAVAVSTGPGATPRARYLATVGQAASGTPWTADMRSAFRSITKSFVGTAVLQLVAQGRVGIDDPVAKYVPAVAGVQYGGVPVGGQITVRQALQMRTGLPEFSSTQGFSDQLNSDYTGAFTDAQLLGYAFAQPLNFAPGAQYEYSNTNFVLLGKVIEAVTGSPWDRELQSSILGPLGLTSVAYSGDQDPAAPVATPYQATDAGLESLAQVSPSMYGASGGYFGSIADLLTWGRALGSGALLPAALQKERLTSVSNPADDPGSPEYDGYGLAAGSLGGWWGHTGTGLGYESLTMYQPSTGTTVAILINTQLGSPNGAAELFEQLEPGLAALG
ncbi:D-alanyl-D-alanine carboxypeptidase [Sinomonas atrocyanea]|uniref:serine hydrolase domain-containing protein n=1 Tax=Sinomonas atrocyanea TaxID=37927 RepID=UPI0027831D5B|nr:serine hydrolase domain-containing protein [Sinomonas atrocyanea]MDP9882780.1 D-alanyl-D-alanine carboxypeptidase [Sinomonas atrocyanea]